MQSERVLLPQPMVSGQVLSSGQEMSTDATLCRSERAHALRFLFALPLRLPLPIDLVSNCLCCSNLLPGVEKCDR